MAKHGRKDVPFTYERNGQQYLVHCDECGHPGSIGTGKWLPDEVVVTKFVRMGWATSGYVSPGIPRTLTCPTCQLSKEAKRKEKLKVVQPVSSISVAKESVPMEQNMPSEKRLVVPEFLKQRATSQNAQLIDEAFDAGNHTYREINAWLKSKNIDSVPLGTISGRLHRIREALKLGPERELQPRKPRQPRTKPSPETALGNDVATGQRLSRELVAWVHTMKASGFVVDLKTVHEEGELVGLDIELHLSVR